MKLRIAIAVVCGSCAALLFPYPLHAQPTFTIRENTELGSMFHVSMRVQLDGSLSLPPEKNEKNGQKLTITGKSLIEYDERILEVKNGGKVTRSIRNYQQLEFERKVGQQLQQSSLRAGVRRLVILRYQHVEVPFSPDGPLTWGEIDLVRTDVFTPALRGLLPQKPVQFGNRWTAGTSAVLELTDFVQIDKGTLVCKLDSLTNFSGRKHARISFHGVIEGLSDEGISKQRLDGYLYFDLEKHCLCYLSLQGVHYLLDQNGTAVGRISGKLVLTRQPIDTAEAIMKSHIASSHLTPNDDNTLLLFAEDSLGIRLLYPRRWHIAGVRGRQIGIDAKGGSGMLLTIEPLNKVPTGKQFLQESQNWLKKQKARILGVEPVKALQTAPTHIEHFALDVGAGKQKFRMYYLVVRQKHGGVVIAARLQKDDQKTLQREVQRIARSIELTKKQ